MYSCGKCGTMVRQIRAHTDSRVCRSTQVIKAMDANGWMLIGTPKWHRVLVAARVPCRRVRALPQGNVSDKALCPPIDIDYLDLADGVFAPPWVAAGLAVGCCGLTDEKKHWRGLDPLDGRKGPAIRQGCISVLRCMMTWHPDDQLALQTVLTLGGPEVARDFVNARRRAQGKEELRA